MLPSIGPASSTWPDKFLGGMLLEATENLYRIDGSNVVYRNNLAAALLSERQNPEKALRLTLEIIQEYEDGLDSGALKTPYHLAWLEIAFERQDMEAARRHARESRRMCSCLETRFGSSACFMSWTRIGRKLRRIFCRQLNQKTLPACIAMRFTEFWS